MVSDFIVISQLYYRKYYYLKILFLINIVSKIRFYSLISLFYLSIRL